MHKDIGTVMKALNIKDTIGKTSMATFAQYSPKEKCLVLKRDNSEQLAFYRNNLEIVIPKHEH